MKHCWEAEAACLARCMHGGSFCTFKRADRSMIVSQRGDAKQLHIRSEPGRRPQFQIRLEKQSGNISERDVLTSKNSRRGIETCRQPPVGSGRRRMERGGLAGGKAGHIAAMAAAAVRASGDAARPRSREVSSPTARRQRGPCRQSGRERSRRCGGRSSSRNSAGRPGVRIDRG